jgi:tetratricopeptide (TPR) repeat protein
VQPPPADPLVGRTVAHYEVVARLGGGGMGVVYTARDTRLGRRVALKFLPPQWSHDESAKERFVREAQAASATDHPNICTIHDIGTTDDGQLFIVMAHYDGDTLKKRLEGGALGVDEAIDIAAQIAEGLAKAHAEGVVHRDVKPGNLMLTETGVKILDFGLAKMADSRLTLTLEGSTVGTIAYMSPEQLRGDEADARSDVWGLGAVLYEMLAGRVPFKGGYPEAIAHAIRHEPPAPLRTSRPEVSEALEQLVFRALHKDPAVRFQTARDMARALRRLQGRTLPLDLRTEPLPPVDALPRVGRRLRWTRGAVAAMAAIVGVLVATLLWVFLPAERLPVAVAPVMNQTGYAELDPYRLALTQELTAQLTASRVVRVLPYDRLLQIVRPFRHAGNDISSREALQAIAMHSGAQLIVVPTLLYENGAWRARVDLRDPQTATTRVSAETGVVVSSLAKNTTYGLMPPLAGDIDAGFVREGSMRIRLAGFLRNLSGRRLPARSPRMGSIDAAAALEQGLDAYAQEEYAEALRAFTVASAQDPRNPLPFAWRSRAARLMRLDDDAAEAAEQAVRLMGDQTLSHDRLFIETVAAEARRDAATAETRLRALISRFSDDVTWVIELAAFQDRQASTREGWSAAVATYHQSLALDGRLMRPHLELCRLYNRLQEPARAKDHGLRALTASRELGARGAEALALFCLTDALRVGSEEDRREARTHAEEALKILQELQFAYNLPSAHYYVGLAAAEQGRLVEAAGIWQRAADLAREARNRPLELLLLRNLGVAHERLGNGALAADFYRQSATLYERLGDELRAAQLQANSGALRIAYGEQPDEALREVQSALVVLRRLGDANYQVVCLLAIGAYYRHLGRDDEAELEINRALALARERNVDQRVSGATADLARVRYERGDYAGARALLLQAAQDGSGRSASRLALQLGAVHTKLGDFAAARANFSEALADIEQRQDVGLRPVLYAAMGELAYESGRLGDARKYFREAASFRTDSFVDGPLVAAQAYVGLLDALAAQPGVGRKLVEASVQLATRMQRIRLVALCRVFLARIHLLERRPEEAFAVLADLAGETERRLGRELEAHVHYWRSRTLAARGDTASADAEIQIARKLVADVVASLPETYRVPFAARPDIRAIVQ